MAVAVAARAESGGHPCVAASTRHPAQSVLQGIGPRMPPTRLDKRDGIALDRLVIAPNTGLHDHRWSGSGRCRDGIPRLALMVVAGRITCRHLPGSAPKS